MKCLPLVRILLSVAALSGAAQASPLSNFAEQAGVTWLIGKWATVDGAVKMSFEWRLDKQVIATKMTLPDREAEGTIALKPATTEANMISVDSKGAVSMGRWSEYEGHPLLKSTIESENGKMKLATRYIKQSDDSFEVKVYRQGEAGQLGEFVVGAEFKRAQ